VFIALEGCDGSGKTGALAHLGEVLSGLVLTREPGGTAGGQAIRGLLLARGTHDWEPRTELLLIAAARAQHVARVIRPSLADGLVVVSDRYVGSTLAYQGAGRGLDPAEIRMVHKLSTGDLWPDLTVVLDVDPEVALARGMARLRAEASLEDRFEALGLDFQHRVRWSFLDQAAEAPERHAVIDANRPEAAVRANVAAVVLTFLRRRGAAPDPARGLCPLDPHQGA
jgi:dTMP kinase